MYLIILFVVCTAVNVVLNTIKSILTVKGGKLAAAIINAVTFGFYTYVVILTANENLGTTEKMLITAAINFVGVYIVKWIEEKMRKDKLWRIDVTIPSHLVEKIHEEMADISHSIIPTTGKYTLFSFYCNTQAESLVVREMVKKYNAKYFASETKIL